MLSRQFSLRLLFGRDPTNKVHVTTSKKEPLIGDLDFVQLFTDKEGSLVLLPIGEGEEIVEPVMFLWLLVKFLNHGYARCQFPLLHGTIEVELFVANDSTLCLEVDSYQKFFEFDSRESINTAIVAAKQKIIKLI